MPVALQYLRVHWWLPAAAIVAVIAYVIFEFVGLRRRGPRDTVGNGIAVGRAKAFDNRSLALRIERLSASLDTLKVVSQDITQNLSTPQKQTTSDVSRSVTVEIKAPAGKSAAPTSDDTKNKDDKKSDSAPVADSSKPDAKPAVAQAAGDILNDQLSLASQIVNLETLYERSLTDRLINGRSRLQTVLGFQISITPPGGEEDCAAIAEVAVRRKAQGNVPSAPVSLVALIPQEKTYNAQSVSTSSQSIGGSAVAKVLTLGFTRKGESRELFIHRDSDTIAFERDCRTTPTLFDDDATATIFGWEFRPVLGRRAVSPGIRQMLAVVALPDPEEDAQREVTLEIRTRTYWRRYSSTSQTTRRKWGWRPWWPDLSCRIDSPVQELVVPNTATIQHALAPKIAGIQWVNSGGGRATVIVKGENFFSGTKAIIDGATHREEDGTLILKSDQALEFETPLASLATSDSVLSGRFGSSFQLMVPADKRPVEGIEITRATITPSRFTKSFRISIDIKGIDSDGNDHDLTVADVAKLPEPILFIGDEPVAMPYDYFDRTNVPIDTSPISSPVNYVNVEAWISSTTLSRNPSVAFRIPFCGMGYRASQPLSFSEPTITRLGGDTAITYFRIAYPVGFSSSITVELDQIYAAGSAELMWTSKFDYCLRVPTPTAQKFQNIVVRVGTDAEPYVLSIPGEEKPKPKTAFDTTMTPLAIPKGTLGPVSLTGTALDAITAVTLRRSLPPATPVAAQFAAFNGGKSIQVAFSESSTDALGKAELEFLTGTGDLLRFPIFITKKETP